MVTVLCTEASEPTGDAKAMSSWLSRLPNDVANEFVT
jgi:hypothetical protein